MLKGLYAGVAVSVGLLFLLAGCDEFSNRNISVRLTLSHPIRVAQPVNATIAVDFHENIQGVGIMLSGNGAGWEKAGAIKSWNVGQVTNG